MSRAAWLQDWETALELAAFDFGGEQRRGAELDRRALRQIEMRPHAHRRRLRGARHDPQHAQTSGRFDNSPRWIIELRRFRWRQREQRSRLAKSSHRKLGKCILRHGCVDVQGCEIAGWAFDSDAADGRCQIEICVRDCRVVFFSGSHRRDDVARHFDIETASNTGFSIDISSLCQIGSNLVSVKFQCDGESLENGEFVAEIVYVPPLDIIAGVDGYWFYTGDKSEVVRHMTGAATLSSKDIMRIAIRLSGTATVTEAHGGVHIFCVAPDKIVIHPSAFNDTFKVYEDRTSQLFLRKYTEYFGGKIL